MLIGGGTAAAFSGYKWYSFTKSPDIDYLLKKKSLIAALAETIIPQTTTAGAKAAHAEDFILSMLQNCTERKTLNQFVDGLKSVEDYTAEKYNKEYQACSKEEQAAVMTHFKKRDSIQPGLMFKIRRRTLGNPFYTTLRQYTIEGFCTSAAGATEVLRYVLVPGRYDACIPLKGGETTWATR